MQVGRRPCRSLELEITGAALELRVGAESAGDQRQKACSEVLRVSFALAKLKGCTGLVSGGGTNQLVRAAMELLNSGRDFMVFPVAI